MDLTAYIGIGFYYLFFLVGSITIGYFVLRVSYPEVRTYDPNKKLAASGMLGLAIVFLSYLTNIFFFGVDRFLNLDSYIEVFTVLYAVVFFLAFKYYYSYTPKFMTVAMPVGVEAPQVQKEKSREMKKPAKLRQLKEEITGREVEISVPLKEAVQARQPEGVKTLREEILESETPKIEIPLKQTIEIPTKIVQQEKPVAKKETKPQFTPHPPPKQPEKAEKPEEGFKFKKQPESERVKQEPKPQKQPEEGFKFQKKQEQPKTKEEGEIAEILKDVVKETVEEAWGMNIPKHRRYLLSQQQKEKVKIIASSDMAGKEEFQALVQDVYEELRKTKTEGNIQKITPDVPTTPTPKKEQKAEEKKEKPKEKESKRGGREKEAKEEKPVEALSLSEVLGGVQQARSTQPQEAKPTGLFAQLSGITETPKEQKTEFVKIESESGMGCPNCHAKNTRIVFCPYCGGAMCTNCSPQIKIEGDHFIFTCPHCGEEVYVKKKK